MLSTLSRIGHSGLFDAAFYLARNPDLRTLGSGVLAHYHEHGWREGRKPNPYFDPHWYLSQNRDVVSDPLLHYICEGEREGRRPIAWFDPAWYSAHHDVPEGMLALAHYLANRHKPGIRPLPEFDAAFYLRAYPDVAASGLDALEHYMIQGFREVRKPFEAFDPAYYRTQYLRHAPDENPLLHYIAHRDRPGIHPARPAEETTIPREVRRTTAPGPFFEEFRPLPASAQRRARLLAYYLPQFHATQANDRWWGKGFTEWTNIARGMPRFAGHYQPRIPRDLGHYTLDSPDILARQAEMARLAGIEGFVFYFYWFGPGQRLLDGPLELLLAHPEIDLPFCLMWANESWSRRWDGSEEEVLIAQEYAPEHEADLVACFARHMRDPRYIRVGERPLLMIYRPGKLPDAPDAIARWRRIFRESHGMDPLIVMAQAFGDTDPRPFRLDGAVEFPPHKLVEDCALITEELHLLDDDFTAQVYDYKDVTDQALAAPAPDFPLIRTVAPSWDNDARRQGRGLVLHGSTPPLYESWLAGTIAAARAHPFHGDSIVCINAWNEWAEGAYLEPDLHFGAAYLNATARACTGFEQATRKGRLLLIGHDAFPAGAQQLLLAIARQLRARHGLHVLVLLLEDGALKEQYQAVAPVEILRPGTQETRLRLRSLAREGFSTALVNSAAASPLAPDLDAAGIGFTLLIHELPSLLRQRDLCASLARAEALARHIVVPAAAMLPGRRADATHVLPQGLYTPVAFSAADRETLRGGLGLRPGDRLVVGAGYADMRKGFDLFLQLWQRIGTHRPPGRQAATHFLWLGDMDPALRDGLAPDIAIALASGCFHMPGRVEGIGAWLSAADAFALTSREDPFPSVVLEALAAGLPCCAFAGSGGVATLLSALNDDANGAHGLAPMGDVGGMARHLTALMRGARDRTAAMRKRIGRRMAARFAFDAYVERLMALTCPDMPRLSVVVPSYNYARYLAARLVSIFAQHMPVLEIIVLDDASTDDSVAVARATAAEWGRDIRILEGRRNSGSVFAQWRKAAELARGDWLWIAEADDLSEPDHMARLFNALAQTPGAVMAFCDSRAIDAAGATVMPSYQAYYAHAGGDRLARDGAHEGAAFLRDCLGARNLILNASSAVFDRRALLAAMKRCRDDLSGLDVAGDWRVYVEMLGEPGARLAYVAAPLNIHRRHDLSTSGRLSREAHLAEIIAVQDKVSHLFPQDATLHSRQRGYRRELITQFGLTPRIVVND
ncbi:glycoside hydrolase family 99-like domain-containing protein [Acidomonas methanolica]|uniref:glycoside hydrolase family 99-like domain-containing protein n=1 Tax=Acidomonas methanolica TaxID=437 RepID=UPI00211A2E4F|nr:glycoside hydrolase family 99-like domain-containing protein [Acidomonas methanolica]MCQ9156222.1 glycoside hydrolase family 99-like domain-containing protein [Acidomonas methanolica]